MAQSRKFMTSFAFPADRAGEFFRLFAPFMEYAENFECTTVNENVPEPQRGHRTETEQETLKRYSGAATEDKGEPRYLQLGGKSYKVSEPLQSKPMQRGNPTTSEQARERFRLAQRGIAPSAREILTKEFGHRDHFLLAEAIEALVKRGLSPRTAGPTLNNMKSKGLAEYLSTNKFRIKSGHPKNGAGRDEGTRN